jgi:hypothetical protein
MTSKKSKPLTQQVHNPLTGEMMEVKTYSGKELLWKRDMTPEETIALDHQENNEEKEMR